MYYGGTAGITRFRFAARGSQRDRVFPISCAACRRFPALWAGEAAYIAGRAKLLVLWRFLWHTYSCASCARGGTAYTTDLKSVGETLRVQIPPRAPTHPPNRIDVLGGCAFFESTMLATSRVRKRHLQEPRTTGVTLRSKSQRSLIRCYRAFLSCMLHTIAECWLQLWRNRLLRRV